MPLITVDGKSYKDRQMNSYHKLLNSCIIGRNGKINSELVFPFPEYSDRGEQAAKVLIFAKAKAGVKARSTKLQILLDRYLKPLKKPR